MSTLYESNIEEPITSCPSCGSDVWANRASKTNPRGPGFRCKNETCEERAYWLKGKAKAAKATPAKAISAATPLNWAAIQRDAAALVYTAAHALATGLKCEIGDVDQRAVAAQAATLLGRFSIRCELAPRHTHMAHEVALEFTPEAIAKVYAVKAGKSALGRGEWHDIT